MIVGYPPFFSDDPSITCQKIIHWRKTLTIPTDTKLSSEAINLIKQLLCDSDHRLGIHGVQEIKEHPFFKGLNWNTLRASTAPFIPDLSSETDTKNFDKFEEDRTDPFYPENVHKPINKMVLIRNEVRMYIFLDTLSRKKWK